jgi:parallel beta-helix repeat protein
MKRASIGAVVALVVASLAMGVRPVSVSAASLCVAPGGAGGCYSTIQAAVDASAAGDTITVAAGQYNENVMITKAISLTGAGAGKSILNAVTSNPKEGIIVDGVSSGNTVISGFTVQNAALSGILVQNSTNVTVENNVVQNNDRNLVIPTDPNASPSCAGAFPFDQDDCGEAIHLRGAANSTIVSNVVQNDAGGILLTDETAATHDNVISLNTVQNNILDCGITLASHPSAIVPPTTPNGQPTFKPGFNVYNNTVSKNTVIGNGAAGVGIFASVPGTGSHDNLVEGNTIIGNGIAGVTLHSHAPGQNIDNNKIIGNTVGVNNLFGDPDTGDIQTTGIGIMGAVLPVKGTVIMNNVVTGNEIGIWLANTRNTTMSGNSIQAGVAVEHASPPAQAGANPFPEFLGAAGFTPLGVTGQFTVAFNSTNPGQGMVLFGTGPGCAGLVETATQDVGAGSTFHVIRVTGNDMPGTVGDIGIQPGVTYYYEMVTVTSKGTEVDNNGGKCYSVTIPPSTFTP